MVQVMCWNAGKVMGGMTYVAIYNVYYITLPHCSVDSTQSSSQDN